MNNLPLTVRRSIELIGLYFLGVILVVGKGVLTPILLAFFITIVLFPLFKFLQRKKVPEVLAITLCILSIFIIAGGIIWFLSSQIGRLLADFPQIKENVMMHLNSISSWINEKTNFSSKRQVEIINEQSNMLLDYAGGFLGGAAASLTSIFIIQPLP